MRLFWVTTCSEETNKASSQMHAQAELLGFFSFVFNFSSFYLQIFPGNSDNNVHKKNVFDPPFYARFVRVLPWEWHERITLRMELLGCED